MARATGFTLGILALSIPVIIVVFVLVWDAAAYPLAAICLPLSILLLACCLAFYRGTRRRREQTPFWWTPTILAVLTGTAYGVVFILLSIMHGGGMPP